MVYEGVWRNMQVAVKVIIFEDNQRGEVKRKQNAILETAITTSMVSREVGVVPYYGRWGLSAARWRTSLAWGAWWRSKDLVGGLVASW